jgi:tetratricopeptide (TPR) repeat protein
MSTFMFRALAASAVAAAVLTGVCFWSRLPASEAGGPDQPLRQIMSPGDTLTDDGRIGKVTDVQGIVAIQPGMAQRWSPLAGCMPVRPGDWLRTDPRGANAVSLQLVGQARLVLGPGTLVEVVSSRQVRIAEGELRVVASARQPVELVGPDGGKTVARARQFYRVEKRSLVGVAKEPPWLASYEGKTAHESIGSLVAKVDGRDVPLTVGYHKVAVDIRDQIARTTVEESFVNQTKATLEGVFYFPLPQDASIAGFGMWIGDRLVEADVVEKQRAREIYETILREHRDPGLLEWSGGNIFKARVFPILPQSEKRITITYTEVLPLRGNAYRYQYGLQSELLRQHPLRQLEIDVKISSAVPLRRVASPTHPTRNSLTAHAAHAEFSALEYTPAEDFEVLAELDGRQPELVLIPHRRGDDGYFMLQLTPPGAPASQEGWQRQTLGDGPPLELLIVADTSASMDAASRNLQAEFVAAILGSLGPKDKFNLAACDVDCPWVFARPMAAEAGNIERARQFLAARVSLGWSDLDRAMASAMKQCGPATQVVYIGDGIVTTGDGDPAAFARRLRRLAEGKPGTFHAVVAGNSFEPGVLKAIASIGGGSMRQIGGSRSPRVVALELLREISQPVLRDARIKFRGIRAARVYPETLPNLPQGTQQIILGRYLPEPGDQAGEVIVTGALAGKPVRYAAQVLLKGAGAGNSYIPRLWARMHLDALLQQGTAAPIRDEIIALSEEYHIITPYTSLLVLDNDADRQRFQVKPHFRLRDGEKFFAQGRDTANWDLIQQQMKRAGTWRLGLRREVLRELGTLGRDPKAFVFPSGSSPWSYQPGTDQSAVVGYASLGLSGARDYSGWGRVNINTLAYEEDAIENRFLQDAILAAGLPEDNSNFSFFVGFLDGHGSRRGRSALADLDILTDSLAAEEEKLLDETHEIPVNEIGTGANDDLRLSAASISAGSWDTPVSSMDLPDEDVSGDGEASADWAIMKEAHALQEKTKILVQEADEPIGVPPEEDEASNRADMNMGATTALGLLPFAAAQTGGLSAYGRPPDFIGMPLLADRSSEMSMCRLARSEPWFDALFPVLPPPPVEPKERKSRWPAEARQLARSLLRRDALTGVKDGLRIETRWQGFDPRHQEPTGGADALALVWPVGWLLRSAGDDSPTTLAWCDGHQRAVVNGAFLLGRARTATPADLLRPPVDLGPGAELPLDLVYRNFSVQVTPQSGGRKMLVLTAPFNAKYEIRMLIDAARSVVLRVESVVDGKVDAATTLDDFVQVVGAWYAGRIETTDSRGRRTSLVTRKITALGPGERDRQWNAEMAALAIPQQVQLLRQPLGKLSDARKAEAAGKATFEDEISLLLDFAASQQWDRVFTHLDRAEKLSGKPGMKWVRSALLDLGRRREELRVRIMAEAGRLAKEAASVRPLPPGDLMCLSQHMLDQSSNIFQANETLALLDVLRPIYARQPDGRRAMKKWTSQRIDGLQRAGRATDALKLREEQVRQWPHDADLQETCARTLAETGEYDAALAWLDRAMADENRWDADQRDALASLRAELLHSAGRYDEMADFLARWLPRNPQGTKLYEQYLSSLFWADRTDALDALIQWLKEGRRPGPLPPEVDARLGAAVELALGHVFYLNTNHVEPRWLAALGETAIYSARQDSPSSAGDRIMYDLEFRNTVEYHRVCKVVAQMLRDEMERLSPERFLRLVGWISSDESAVEPQLWQKIAGRLRRCWETEPKPEIKHQLGQSLSTILSDHVSKSEWLAFLRAQLADAPDDYRPIYALQLFGALLSQPWSDAYEREAFSLVRQLTDAEDPIARLTAEIAAVHRLTDRFAQARFDARAKAIDHPEKLTRTQLREGRAKALRLAREGLADRLREAARTAPPELARWVDIEATYLDVISGRDLDRAGQQCWKLLGDAPRPETSPLDAILQRRSLATLLNLAARKNAPPGLADRVMKWLEGAARSEPDQPRWKQSQYQLLVALDRPKDLEKRLRQWIDAGDPGSPWRLTLGYLLAEQGRLAEAIGLLEAVLAGAALRGAELRLLADWYSATNRREDHDRAMIDAFKTVEEGRLDNWLSRKLWPWQRRDRSTPPPPPRELDPQVPPAFAALLEKSPRPGNYLRQLRDAYQATGDFRLLAGLADSMVGHTAGQVYSFLQGMSDVLSPIGDEATVDSIADQIAKVRGRAKTATDQRALDLLEMFVQRRAAELKNQPGPHAARALASLRRAWKREWSPGERPLLAGLLASLGRMPDPQLAEEQVRQLESLHREAVAGSSDRLQIAHELARVLWSYSRRDAAIDLLTAALDEYQAASGGVLPSDAFGGPYGRGVGHSYGYGSSYGYGVANASADESAGEPFSHAVRLPGRAGPFRPGRDDPSRAAQTPGQSPLRPLAHGAAVRALPGGDRP